jgi:DNA-binding NarL/FixJ family response regulator
MVDPAPALKPIRVLVLDDHEIVRRGLVELLSMTSDLVVVGEASTAAEALNRIPAVRPDVALLDVMLPDGNGIDVCREVRSRFPEVSCLMLTSSDDDEALFAAVMAGAAGYLTKQIRSAQLVQAIRDVAAGKSLLNPAVTRRLIDRLSTPTESKPEDPLLARLTDRERQILELIADGRTNRQIGQEIYLAEKTVKNAVSTILAKLGLERRTQAAVYADRLRAPRNAEH